MAWFPLGPDFVFAPRDASFKRLSRRNELGRQGAVTAIAIHPNAATMYAVARPDTGEGPYPRRVPVAFGTKTGGMEWHCITDALHQKAPNADPTWIAINLDHPLTIYMGTGDRHAVFVSDTEGDAWSGPYAIPGFVRKIIVDPRFS